MFIKRMQISFLRHKSKTVGKAQLYGRITMEGERACLGSTGLTIYYDHWDGEKISDQDPESFFKNEQLDIMRNQLRAIFNDLFRHKEKITPAKIKRIYQGGTVNLTLLSAFSLYLKESASDPERNLTKSTLEVYDNVRKKLVDFLLSQQATDLLVEDFDLTWVKKYRYWMKTRPLDVGKIGHADSYIVKQTQTIKNVLIWSKLHKLGG